MLSATKNTQQNNFQQNHTSGSSIKHTTHRSRPYAPGRMLFLLGLLVVVFTVSWHCTGDVQCQYDSDCSGDKVCREGRCGTFQKDGGRVAAPCKHDTDCPGVELCVRGWCTPTGIQVEANTEPYPYQEIPLLEPPAPKEPTPPTEPHPPSEAIPEADGGEPLPPPELGPTPVLHVFSSGAASSSSPQYKHFGTVGFACPLIPTSTVMRSPNYSVRPGFIAVSVW